MFKVIDFKMILIHFIESGDDCVPLNYACDNIGDCAYDADEDTAWCESLPASQCADYQVGLLW